MPGLGRIMKEHHAEGRSGQAVKKNEERCRHGDTVGKEGVGPMELHKKRANKAGKQFKKRQIGGAKMMATVPVRGARQNGRRRRWSVSRQERGPRRQANARRAVRMGLREGCRAEAREDGRCGKGWGRWKGVQKPRA